MSPFQQRGDELANGQERMLFLLASFFPEGTPIPLWLLGLAAGMEESAEASGPLSQACQHLQVVGLFEEMTDEHVMLSDQQRQFGQQLVHQEGGIEGKVQVADAAQRLFSVCWTVDTLKQRVLRVGYEKCRKQVQSIRLYLDWLGFKEFSELIESLDHWLNLENSLLADPIIGINVGKKKRSTSSSSRSLPTLVDVTWWAEILLDLFYQQLYNRSIEAGSLLTIQEKPARWLRLIRKVGAENYLFWHLYIPGSQWWKGRYLWQQTPRMLRCLEFSPT